MAKNKPNRQMEDQTAEYMDDLPDEDVLGDMIDDDGHPMGRSMPNDDPVAPMSERNKSKRGNQPRG